MSTKTSSDEKKTSKPSAVAKDTERSRVSQTDVPSYSLEQALRVAKAIGENYAFRPTKPLNIAAAMNMQPGSGHFRMLCGASAAYGITTGSAWAPEIAIEPLGMRIVRPTKEGDDLRARREALLKPRIIGDFLRKYAGASVPRNDIAINMLVEMGVPSVRAKEVLALILDGARSVGFIQDIKDKHYVNLDGAPKADPTTDVVEGIADLPTADEEDEVVPHRRTSVEGPTGGEGNARRVFITHGRNKAFIEPIKKLLGFGELEAVISTEKTSVSQPVPDKVINDMRTCGAAIIHVEEELRLLDKAAEEHIVLNPNVLIEIGAAMALYGRRFILLVKEGVSLPSNLQGLFEVRYSGDSLDGAATIKLLEAINDIKNHPLPSRYSAESSNS